MSLLRCVSAAALAAAFAMAQPALPGLRIEPIDAGTVLFVKNTGAQPLTAFLVEMVDYPGSSFTHWFDDLPDGIAPGTERRFQVSNQLPGAVPDYVKMQAAVFADGSTAGTPAKVGLLVQRRRALLTTTREVLRLLSTAADKQAAIAALRPLLDSASAGGRPAVARALSALERGSLDDTRASVRQTEATLAASKPPL